MKKNRSPRGSKLLALTIVCPVLWLAVLSWPSVAHSQQETRWPTHYVIVVRNTSLKIPVGEELISKDEFGKAVNSIPKGLAAAGGQIPLWRKPEPGDSISVVFAAAGKNPKPPDKPDCESPHYPDSSISGQSTGLELNTYFDVRARIVVEEQDSPSDIADPSSRLHQKLFRNLGVKDCDLIANAYLESLTLAKGLAAVEVSDTNGEEKYKQFFLLVFDFASPAYGSTEFNATFKVSHEDLEPGTPEHFISPIGSLKFTAGEWSLDLINYLDYPAEEPGGTSYLKRDDKKFYPRLRFYRAVAYEASSDPFYDLANARREAAILEEKFESIDLQVAHFKQENTQLKQENDQLKGKIEGPANIVLLPKWQPAFLAWIAAATFALLMVLVTWRWCAIKGRFRQMTEEFREKQAALEAEKEKYKSLLTGAVCIPDVPNTNQASESA